MRGEADGGGASGEDDGGGAGEPINERTRLGCHPW